MTLETTASNPPDPAVLLARAGWLRVLDDLHGGLCHDIAGRVSSLDGLVQLLRMDDAGEMPVVSYIDEETARLAATSTVLRSLAGKVDRPAEPALASDIVERVAALQRKHRGLEGLEVHTSVAEGLPPVRVSGPRLLRALLIVTSHAGLAARDRGIEGLELTAGGDGDRLLLRVSWHGTEAVWDTAGVRAVAEPLAEVLAIDGGLLELRSDGVEVSLPAMVLGGEA